ncbi:uncharacterized protein Tco025E_03504 [Trypanosoma conorhini]|uniref:Uncharacterized protein n=1 Tax=Trypanosoma conorhini TaxID=83891 RepID=A0A3R7L776_9TRYP|nr:uncharacterized protein Tco025E_03504 [Trypanosoma conorhini]RNF21163.1 hypothetical protein Tco025E_03504 [Trypanosoma conorhini]
MHGASGTSDTDQSLTAESPQETSPRSFKTTSDEENDAFRTCMSGGTEDASGSPLSSRRTISKKLNLGAFYGGVRFRAGSEAADRTSEESGRRSDVRGLLSIIYSEQERGLLHWHRRSKEHDHNPALRDTVESAVPVVSAPPGTPLKKRKDAHESSEWASTHYTALEQLRLELEDRLRTDTHFRPELREVAQKKEEAIDKTIETQEEEDEEGDQRQLQAMARELRRPGEPIDACPVPKVHVAAMPDAADPRQRNGPTIDLSDIRDASYDESFEATRRAEERTRERRQRTEAEVRNRELLECTFHPQVSPNSAMLFQKASQDKGNVFERLYPQGLQEQADRVRDARLLGEMESLEREERESLRERCGGVTSTCTVEDTFELFLHNVLGSRRGHKSSCIETDYQSPLSQKMRADAAVGNADSSGVAKTVSRDERRYRMACFDEFLQRQNEHHRNRFRSVQHLVKTLTPSFKPVITEHSLQLAKKLIARSSISPPDSNNVSVLASAVKKHHSHYVDPCTFKPKITAVSSAMAPRGVEEMAKDSMRLRERQRTKQEKAAAAEVNYPFRPTLNDARNTRVESLLTSKNYPRYEECLKRRKEQRAKLKREQEALKERDELERSTFHPQTTRKPAYVTRMASSFALVRQQYGEL